MQNEIYLRPREIHCVATGRLCLIVCCVLLHGSRLLGDDKVMRSAFLESYKRHAEKSQRFYANIRAKCIRTYNSPNDKQRIHTMDAKCSGLNYLLESVSKVTDKTKPNTTPRVYKEVTGWNARYHFTLSKKGDKLYLLNNLVVHNPGNSSGFCFLTAPFADYRFGHQLFLDMATNVGVEFLEFQDCVWQNKPSKKLKVRLTTHYGMAMQKTAEMIVSYYFSPHDGWICQGMQGYAVNNPSSMREEIYSYEQQEGKQFPVLKRCEEWIKDPGNPAKARLSSVTEITDFEHLPSFAESDFTLTAFGLPEPYGVVWKKGPAWYLWFFVLAVAFLALGWYFRRRVRQRDAGLAGLPHLRQGQGQA